MNHSIATLTNRFKFNLNDCLKVVYPYLRSDTFGVRLRKIRRNNNISTKQLSNIIKISTGTIISYENCNCNPSPNIIIKLYNLFGNAIICDEYIEFIISDYTKLLESWRIKRKLSKKEASKILEISENTYLDYINNKVIISRGIFNKIKSKLSVIKKKS